jgi:hypothetical protein
MRLATGLALLAAGLALACSGEPTASEDPTVASVAVAPGAVTLVSLGGSMQLSATARNAGGTTVPATFTWISSNPSIATVNATGSATAVSNGTASITATAAGIGSNAVTVTVAQELAAVEVTPADDTLVALGDASLFAAAGTDALGNTIDGGYIWEWSSLDVAVATVDSEGNATALGVGSTSITATTAGVSGSGQLLVAPVPVGRLDMPASVGVGDPVSVDVQLLSTGYGSVTGAFAFTVSFDPLVLQYSGATSTYYVTAVSDNTGGDVRIVASVPTGLADNVTAATIVFDVVGGAGAPTDLDVSIDALIAPSTFIDFTADGVGQTRSLIIQ